MWFLLAGLAVGISYAWLDRPIALLAHDLWAGHDIIATLTPIPEITASLLVLAAAAIGLRAAIGRRSLSGRALPKLQSVVVIATLSLAVADAITKQLKFVFGRVWSETWVRDDHVYGFNPFHSGPDFGAFPSRHMAVICAVMSVLWICYPRFRALYALAIAAVAAGLVCTNYHFLGDVIAGGFLGISTGWFTVLLWERGKRHVRGYARPESKSRSSIRFRDFASDFRPHLHPER
jgi:membrane-associated phospholipid phosphatase